MQWASANSPFSLRLVLAEQQLIGPLVLCNTLFLGLNNECAGLPLVLKAPIISQGLTVSYLMQDEDIWGSFFDICARVCAHSEVKRQVGQILRWSYGVLI